MKITRLKANLGGTVSKQTIFENLKPEFGMMASLFGDEQDFSNAKKIMGTLSEALQEQFDIFLNNAKARLVNEQYKNIRFRKKDGKKYPSVTSILGFDIDWHLTADELMQYGARGTIVHRLIEAYLDTGKWFQPSDFKELKDDIIIVDRGSLRLSIEKCSFKKFFEVNRKHIEIISLEKVVFNDEHLYSGQVDIIGKWKGKKAVMDNKTGHHDLKQLCAYAMSDDLKSEGIEEVVILPVGEVRTKKGFKEPIVSNEIKKHFKEFIDVDRENFRKRFEI